MLKKFDELVNNILKEDIDHTAEWDEIAKGMKAKKAGAKVEPVISDSKGRKTKIDKDTSYTVIYYSENGKPTVSQSNFINYPQDLFIGRDDCEGRPGGPHFAFDGVNELYGVREVKHDKIIAIMTDEEFNEALLTIKK